jgi:hypothetical protein
MAAVAAAAALAMCGGGPYECPFFLLFFYMLTAYSEVSNNRGALITV